MSKRKARISGYKLGHAEEYTKKEEDGSFCICLSDIEEKLSGYLKEAESAGKYSVAGFCIALGITRERLEAWREGYFYLDDVHDGNVIRNDELAACLKMGLLHIERFWEECDKSSVQSKHVKMLEHSGAFEEKRRKNMGTPPFDLGSLKKFSK